MDYEATTEAFRLLRLSKAGWTHHAHLAAALWFVLRHGIDQARVLIPPAIRAHNASVGTEDTPTSGYHETLTQLYLSLIDGFVGAWPGPADYSTMAAALCEQLNDRRIPLRYYSEVRLWSTEARTRWVEPDLISDPARPLWPPGPLTGG